MSGSVVEFQAQIASIMEVLANAAVAEICKIVDDGYAVVHLEISQSHKDNDFLRRKLKLMEFQIARFRAERIKLSEGSVHNRFHGIRLLNRHNHREKATTGPTWQSRARLSNRSFGNSSIQRDRQPIDVDQDDVSPSKHMDATSDEQSAETEEGEPDLLIIKDEGEADDQDSRISHPARTVEGSRELTTQPAAATTEDPAFQLSGPRGNNNYNTAMEQSAETEEGQPDLLIIKVEGEADDQDSRISHPARTVEGSRELTTQPAAATTEDPAFQLSGPRGNNNYNNTAMEQSAETEEGEPDLLIIKDEGVADDQKSRSSHPARTVEGSRELTTQPAAATSKDPAFQLSGPRGNNYNNNAMEQSAETEEGEPDLLIIKVEGEADDQDSRISHPARTVEGSRELTTQPAAATTEDSAFQLSGPRGNNNYNNIAMEVSGSDVVFQSETGNVNQGLQQYTGFEPRAERPSLDNKCDMYGGLNLLRDSLNQVCREVVATDNGASAAHTKVMDLGSGPVGLEPQNSSDIEMRSVGLENHRFSPKSFHSSSEHVIVIDSVSSGQQVDREFEWGQVGTATTPQVNGTGNTQGEGVFEKNAPTMASLHRHFEIPGRGVQQPAHTSLPVGHFRQSATTSSHSSNLATHVRPDTIERLYGCLSCHKKFVHESDLRQHVVVHNRKRAFACTLCEKSFMSRTDLQMHLNVHTGEKPFSCAHCGRRFSHSSNLKRHQKLHH
ncbi:zinc finger and BTB domain-containing protein 16-A-like isoform X9 [Oncorhynchus keta]|uniref:zinc finger and BTB domain-containing protein 16-A-like isoform X9 n=1 Tax=Oncorhynchus keta TaxID=8018 RepID=UPI00227D40D2|nr:zinc finger and BTB domain-containing protein 16-A-like isoform X9 [Oncorhynchus keta]